jgi:hypothetical protein
MPSFEFTLALHQEPDGCAGRISVFHALHHFVTDKRGTAQRVAENADSIILEF